MSDTNDIQTLIAAAWSAGYEARETELICRRRSSPAYREAEIAKLTHKIMVALQKNMSSQQEAALVH